MSPKKWFIATRPWSFVMTIVSVSFAAVLALKFETFDAALYLLTLAGLILSHAATNLLNDYYDVKYGVDRIDSPTSRYRPHPLLMGEVSSRSFLSAIYITYGLAILIAGFLTFVRGPLILLFTGIGLFASVFYTAPPIAFKYRALGEPAVLLVWGPLMVGGSYFTISGELSAVPFLASLPIGILVLSVLLANNLRDVEYDRKVVRATLPILLGARKGLTVYAAFLTSAYVLTIALIFANMLSVFSLSTMVTAPIALRLIRTFRIKVPETADPQTARLVLLFGILLIASELASVLVMPP